jgi:dCTP deaminase
MLFNFSRQEAVLFEDENYIDHPLSRMDEPDPEVPVNPSPYTLMPDHEIILEQIVNPCMEKTSEGGLSYGLDPYGYSVRLGNEWAAMHSPERKPLLFKESMESDYHGRPHVTMGCFKEEHFFKTKADYMILYPGEFVLAHTMEYISMPKDVSGWVKDKSTNARCGLAVQNTVLEPGWKGQITLEVTNHGPVPIQLLAGAGIAQVQFIRCVPCQTPYEGKYQHQEGVVLPRYESKESRKTT